MREHPRSRSPDFAGARAGIIRATVSRPNLLFVAERSHKMIELRSGAHCLGSEKAPVAGMHPALQRDAPGYVDARRGNTFELCRIVGQQPHARTAEHLQHANGDAIVTLVILKTQNSIGIDRVETSLLQRVGTDLVRKPEPASLLLKVENDSAAMLLELLQRHAQLIAPITAGRATHVTGGRS